MDIKSSAVAIHESGHAIMAVIYKQKIESLSLKVGPSPNGTGNYLGSLRLVPIEQKTKLTGPEVIQKIMIALSGYASETLFFDGTGKFFGDDLDIAVKWTKRLMEQNDFKVWAAKLPLPNTDEWNHVEDPTMKAYIYLIMSECQKRLLPLKSAIMTLAEELQKKDELTGDDILSLLRVNC